MTGPGTGRPAGARELKSLGPSASVERFERRAMGSPLALTLIGASSDEATGAWQRVDAEIVAAEQALSRFRESSDLTRLNRAAGTRQQVDPRLRRALVAADRAGRVTDGRFDARVLADLERLGYVGVDQGVGEATDAGSEPRTGSPNLDSRPIQGDRWLQIDRQRSMVALMTPVDLGGIGKGLALRWAWRAANEGLSAAIGGLLEAGGDLVAREPSPEGGPWRIAVEDPSGGAEPLAVINVTNGAVATSSVLVNRWMTGDGRAVHHLIDPRTGEPGGAGLLSVTVAGPDPAWAEVWSKALFLAGGREIGSLARSRGLAAWWVGEDGTLEMTPGARPRTIWP